MFKLRRFVRAVAQVFGAVGVMALFASPAAAQVFPPPVFPTPVLSDPGCQSIVDVLVQGDQASARTVAVADFNLDGFLDVVIAEDGSKDYELAVALANGDGTFQTPINIYPGTCCNPDLRGATWAIVGDFDGNGIPDIAAGNFNGYVTILLGNGNGTFTLAPLLRPTDCCTGPTAGAVGDFNGDSKLDLVVTSSSNGNGTAIVYLGNGDGTFQPNPTIVSVGAANNSPASVAVGDFNNDGKLDFATANASNSYNGSTSIVLGMGDGTFQAAIDYPDTEGLTPNSIVTADFNNDSYLDIATLDRGNGLVAVFVNNRDGTFQGPSYYFAGLTDRQTSSMELAVGDFNRDGNADLLVIANRQSSAGVLLGNGNGTFQPGAWYVTDVDANGVAVGDFDGDGNPDFVVSAVGNNSLTVVLGNGDGTFQSARSYIGAANPTSVALGDFNGDSKPDMAVTDADNRNVTIFLNNGDGTFTQSANYSTVGYGTMVAAADFNHDGKLDLVVGLYSSAPGFSVLLGNGDGSFQPPRTYLNGGNASVFTLSVADVNGDGNLDVISDSDGHASLYVTLGNSDGTFLPGIATPAVCPGGAVAYVAIADLNGDGKPDLAAACTANLNQTFISVSLGNGDGTFSAPTQWPAGTVPISIVSGDFNEDGKADLAVLDNQPNPTVSILLGNGDGTFQSPVAYSVFSSPFWLSYIAQHGNPRSPSPDFVVAADFNMDGHLDLLVGDGNAFNDGDPSNGYSYNNGVQLFLGNGDGTFQPEQSYMAGRSGTFLAVADFDGNGYPDAAVVSEIDLSVNVLLNRGGAPKARKSRRSK